MRDFLKNRPMVIGAIFVLLIVANIAAYIYRNWGLITVKVTEAPLGTVIKSIERQGWVTIYTNIPLDTKVSMWVDHVPLAEAMETLSANVTPPPREDRPDRQANGAPGGSGPAPDGAARGPRPDGAPGGGGRGGRGGGGGFGGGGGGGAQWNLAFFVGPSSAAVKQEINAFQSGTAGDDVKVFNFPTPIQMLASEEEMPASDPWVQAWPGYKPAPPPPAPAVAAANTPPAPPPADGSAPPAPPSAPPADASAAAAAPAPDETPSTQTYLRAFAQSSNIWIMAPASWDPAVGEPAANSSIVSAVKKLVGRSNGTVTTAIILRAGRGGGGRGQGGRGGGGFADFEATADRMRNAINGLPPESQQAAREQLDTEVAFFQSVQVAPPEQRPQMMRAHFQEKAGGNNWRKSPESRAKAYSRAVSNRQTAQGKK